MLRTFRTTLELAAPALLAAAVALVAGCGGGAKDSISGTVKTKDGKDVSGEIIFKAGDKEVRGGLLKGKYTVENPPKGDLDVIIKGPPGGAIAGGGAVAPPTKDAAPPAPSTDMGVPPNAKYSVAGQAGMKYKFEGGKKTDVNFDLDP